MWEFKCGTITEYSKLNNLHHEASSLLGVMSKWVDNGHDHLQTVAGKSRPFVAILRLK